MMFREERSGSKHLKHEICFWVTKDEDFVSFTSTRCAVQKSTIPTHAYSLKNQPIMIDYNQFHARTIAVLAAISEERGVDLVMQFKDSINKEKFKIFLDNLRAKYFFDDICIYMDNLSVHKSKDVMERLDELSIGHVFCPIYSPDLNPIENIFSMAKAYIKK